MFLAHDRGIGASVAMLVLIAGGISGCASRDHRGDFAEGVTLPKGFCPLNRLEAPQGDEDDYNGWPRYIVSDRDGMIMAYVPTQTIVLGGGTDADETPARHITVSHFYMDVHEVTNEQFAKHAGKRCPCRDSNGDATFAEFWVPGRNDAHPARNVSWFAANDYAGWARKSLPTEAQWESAARGGDDNRLYPWGNDEQSDVSAYLCNHSTGTGNYDGYEYTAPAMNYAPGVSPFGIFNMSGNVWEWCADWYDPGRYAYPGSEDPPASVQRGPKAFGDENYPNPDAKVLQASRVGPIGGDEKVIRGGSFAEPIERCRVDVRAGVRPGARLSNVGFRTVLVLPAE